MDPITLFLINLAVGAALGLLAEIVKPKAPKQKPSGIRQQLAVGGDEPLSFIMGRYGSAGYLEYVGTWGEVDDVPNAYLTMVISLSDLPVRGLHRLFVDGEEVTIGATHNSKGYPVTITGDGGTRHMWIEFFDGTQTTADSFLLAKFPTGSRRWQSDMIGRGIAYARITTLFNRELFNGIPEFFFEVDGIELDDPRGDNAQTNPIVMVHEVLSGISYAGEWVWGLQDLPPARLPAAIYDEMDKCDVLVDKKGGGTEKRYRAGCEVTVDQQPIDVIAELLESCNGRIAEIGGIYKMLVAEPAAAVVSFTDEDIVISETQSFTPFPGLEATYNAIDATYVEPDERWAIKPLPQLRDADLVDDDDDRLLPADVSFPMVSSNTQAQRLMRALLEEHRRFRSHAMTMPPEWWEYEVLDVAAWTSDRNGYTAKDGLITLMDDLPNGNQFIGWKEQDPDVYDWDAEADEQEFDVVPLETERPPPQVVAGWSVDSYTFPDDGALGRRIGIIVFFAGGLTDIRAVRVQVREDFGSGNIIFDGEVPYDPADPAGIIAPQSLIRNTAYEVRGKFLPFSGRETEWSDWLGVTTDDVGFSSDDIDDGAITVAKFAAGITMPEVVSSLGAATPGEGNLAVLTTDGKLYRYHSGAWTAAVPTVDLTGQIATAQIAVGAVTSAIIANDAVQTANIAALAVTAAQVANATLTGTQIAAATIVGGNIAAATITAAKIAASTITATQIASDTITGSKIAAGTITSTNILAGTITAAKIAAGTLTATQMAAGSITADRLVANTITAAQIAAGAIGATQLAAGAIIAGKISAGAIDTSSLMVDGVVITAKVLNNNITSVVADITASDTPITTTTYGDTTWKDVAEVTITPNGGSTLVTCNCVLRASQHHDDAFGGNGVRLRRDGSTLITLTGWYDDQSGFTVQPGDAFPILYLDTAAQTSSSHTYLLQARNSNSVDGLYLEAAAGSGLWAVNFKK